MSTEIYPLKYPFETSGVRVDALTIRRPKWGDLKAASNVRDEMGQTEMLLTRLCGHEKVGGLSPEDLDKLDAEDLHNISEIIEGFTPQAKKSPDTST